MQIYWPFWLVALIFAFFGTTQGICEAQSIAPLPKGVKAVWDLNKAYREATPTRERVCLNGLWRWRPVENMTDEIPTDGWGYFKVPGPWPEITSYIHKQGGGKPVWPVIQVIGSPSDSLTASEFRQSMITALEAEGSDGLIIFTLHSVIEEEKRKEMIRVFTSADTRHD